MDTDTLRTIVGLIGNVISGLLFLSPMPTMIKIVKQKSVQAFKPDPYIATVLNCIMWVFYGLPIVHPDNILVSTINGAGLIIELIYVAIFLVYSTWATRKKIIIALVFEVVFTVAIVIITLTFFHTYAGRSMIVGLICIVLNVLMYASPLTIMRLVIKTKSVKYMPFYLSLASFCNGTVWVIYALLKFDPYLVIPNGLGTLSATIQLILYATYYKSTNWDDDDEDGQVQMSSSSNP